MITNPFKMPPMILTNLYDTIQFESVIDEIRKARNILLLMRDERGEHRFIYSELGEVELLMTIILMYRHIEVFNFFKLVILDIEKGRESPETCNDFSYKVLEYVRLGNLKNLNLNI